jgi:hypothetical protein
MSKIFTSKEFVDRMKHLNTLPNIYYSGGNKWSSWDGNNWLFDCVVSIKSILWGWCEDKNAPHGGAIYKSNGVEDFTTNGGLDYCSDVSTDFSNLVPGEYLCMAGTEYSHAGIYLGNGRVFEVTTGWGVNGSTISDITSDGTRSRYGQDNLRWTYHGKLNWIDYDEKPTPTYKYAVGDVVDIDGVYVSSNSTEKLVPKITRGTITRIVEGARNPYLLDDGKIGWVNDDCIVDPEPIDYEQKYNEALATIDELNKKIDDLNKNIEDLQNKINKAIEDLS